MSVHLITRLSVLSFHILVTLCVFQLWICEASQSGDTWQHKMLIFNFKKYHLSTSHLQILLDSPRLGEWLSLLAGERNARDVYTVCSSMVHITALDHKWKHTPETSNIFIVHIVAFLYCMYLLNNVSLSVKLHLTNNYVLNNNKHIINSWYDCKKNFIYLIGVPEGGVQALL